MNELFIKSLKESNSADNLLFIDKRHIDPCGKSWLRLIECLIIGRVTVSVVFFVMLLLPLTPFFMGLLVFFVFFFMLLFAIAFVTSTVRLIFVVVFILILIFMIGILIWLVWIIAGLIFVLVLVIRILVWFIPH